MRHLEDRRDLHRVSAAVDPNLEITEIATSAPGYGSVRTADCAPLPETLRLNGYSTAQFGKCHEAPVWETSPLGPFDRRPGRGLAGRAARGKSMDDRAAVSREAGAETAGQTSGAAPDDSGEARAGRDAVKGEVARYVVNGAAATLIDFLTLRVASALLGEGFVWLAGGLGAAIVTDFIQGILTILFSFLLLPFVLGAVGGMTGMRETILAMPGNEGMFSQ